MFSHRFRKAMQPETTPPAPAAFVLVPCWNLPAASAAHWTYQQALYEWAAQQARDVMRPSIVERDLLGVWN